MTLTKQISDQVSAAGLLVADRDPELVRSLPDAGQTSCGYQIDQVLQQIDPPADREIISTVFQNLLGMLECLDLIERRLRQVDAAKTSFELFQTIHDEARALVDFIRTDALSSSLMAEEFIDTLDGISFALSHDLQRVFDPNSRPRRANNTANIVLGKLYRAHDVLTNCLQQSTVTLARVFDSDLVGDRLFNNSDIRYRQSLQLCHDLTTLVQLVEASENTKNAQACASVTAGIEKFHNESMECLMYSDWPQFESFCERIAVTPAESPELESALHQFRCYLETLLREVRMRAVLANVFPVQFGEVHNTPLSTAFGDNAARRSSPVDFEPEAQADETRWSPLALAG